MLDKIAKEGLQHNCAIVISMKTYPNKQQYHAILRRMSPQDKLLKSFELTELANAAFKTGLRNRYPELSEVELERLYREKRSACHNQSY